MCNAGYPKLQRKGPPEGSPLKKVALEQYQSAALSWLRAGHIMMNSARPKRKKAPPKGEAEVEKERVNEAMVTQSAELLVAERTQASSNRGPTVFANFGAVL
jgi:hypothetical protein